MIARASRCRSRRVRGGRAFSGEPHENARYRWKRSEHRDLARE